MTGQLAANVHGRVRMVAEDAVKTADLELASQTLEDGLDFGDSAAAVVALDEAYGAPARSREPAR